MSNPALLLILSQGSDKEAVQQCFSKVFDSIHRVEFAGANITKIKSLSPGYDGQDCEDITLSKPVAAKGNIEDWLTSLLKEMKRTLKDIVRAAASEFESMQWSDFIAKYCAQVTLLGIQFCWTSDVQEALIRLKHDKACHRGRQQEAVGRADRAEQHDDSGDQDEDGAHQGGDAGDHPGAPARRAAGAAQPSTRTRSSRTCTTSTGRSS